MFAMIAGGGRLGAGLAKVLSGQGHDVVVVDEQIDARRLGNGFDGITVNGSPTDRDVLGKAGIGKADLFVAATSDDSTNAMAIQIAKEVFHVPTVLARISDPDRERFFKSLGLNTVCPTTTGINQILDLIRGSALSALAGHIRTDLIGMSLPTEWAGRTLGSIPMQEGRVLVGLLRGDRSEPADPLTVLQKDDALILRRVRTGGGAPCTS